MPTYRLGRGDDRFVSSDTPDWSDNSAVYAGSGDDELVIAGGNSVRLFGGTGDDTVLFDQFRESTACGGAGDDVMSGIAFDSTVKGGSGDDDLAAFGSGNTLSGGTGDDTLTIGGQRISEGRVHGGAGDDLLRGGGFRDNRFDGGAGDDRFETFSAGVSVFGDVATGNLITGGRGHDSFSVSNRNRATVQDDTNGRLDPGEVVRSVMDVITDYRTGEELEFGATELVTDVTLAPDVPPGTSVVQLAAGDFAINRGDYLGDGSFRLDARGDDTLILYHQAGDDSPFTGSLVLLDVTRTDWIAVG
ncbi:hypothetical protein HL658_23760 [Azospirillum sp. RWY-5-1]|uniref:Calcium-binding protein n=1 Tax=Azospirillum oleiclasticum TaxID=2735135 RepID=A0ABX2TEI2_9PROT|nr:hypothetical protein [Azospirillum oleiclasticum]NYZ15568.1 hypothetical protein [Azospirillum oleiclasticum]NYZ22591.1 hypothetical protein [Azospirillum oleiclasticum]